MRNAFALVVLCFTVAVVVACAQDAVPGEILSRTLMIKNNAVNTSGTAFMVEHKGKIYLVTARHMVQGLPVTNATIDVWQDNTWKTIQTVKTLFPQSSQVDIAVLKTDQKRSEPYGITPIDKNRGGPTMGQQVWFLGYPYQIGTQFAAGSKHWSGGAPFIKRGTMSAIDGRDSNAVVLYIDGFNNPGFSGGPIVFWDFGLHEYKIAGVVQGFKPESAKVVVNGQPMDTQLMVNSGILIAYSIYHVNQAIEDDDKQPQ